jgi:hypothetical protein
MIRVKCPNPKCRKDLGIDESKAGSLASCPNCGQKFRLPAPEKVAAKANKQAANKPGTAAKSPSDSGKKPWQMEDDFNPYQVKIEEDKPPPEDDRVDQMVRDDFRQRKREKAWKEVGFPAKLMKIMGLIFLVVEILIFLLISLDVVLYNFKLEQISSNTPSGEKPDLPELFIAEIFVPFFGQSAPGEAPTGLIWATAFGLFVVRLIYLVVVLAGAESMKKLENYYLSMTACILAIPWFFVGLMGLLSLLNEDVKLEFPQFRKQREEKEEKEWAEIERRKRRQREGLPPDEDDEEDEDEEE